MILKVGQQEYCTLFFQVSGISSGKGTSFQMQDWCSLVVLYIQQKPIPLLPA